MLRREKEAMLIAIGTQIAKSIDEAIAPLIARIEKLEKIERENRGDKV